MGSPTAALFERRAPCLLWAPHRNACAMPWALPSRRTDRPRRGPAPVFAAADDARSARGRENLCLESRPTRPDPNFRATRNDARRGTCAKPAHRVRKKKGSLRQTCTASRKKDGVAAPNLHVEPEKRRGRCAKPARRVSRKNPRRHLARFSTCRISALALKFSPVGPRSNAPERTKPRVQASAEKPPDLEKPEQLQAKTPSRACTPRSGGARCPLRASVGSRATVQDLDAVQILNTGCPCACIASGKAPRADVGGRGRLHRRRGGGRARNVDGGCDAAFRRLPAAARKAGEGRGTSPLDAPVRGVARFIRIRLHDDVPRRGSRVLFHKAMGFLVRFPLLSRLRRD